MLVFDNFYNHTFLFILAVASLGIAIGALWEIIEWGYDLYVAQNVIKGKEDTILDLAVDSVAAFFGGWLAWGIVHKERPGRSSS